MLEACKPSLFSVLRQGNSQAGAGMPSEGFQFHYYISVKERKAKITTRQHKSSLLPRLAQCCVFFLLSVTNRTTKHFLLKQNEHVSLELEDSHFTDSNSRNKSCTEMIILLGKSLVCTLQTKHYAKTFQSDLLQCQAYKQV